MSGNFADLGHDFLFAKLHGMWAKSISGDRLMRLIEGGRRDALGRFLAELGIDINNRAEVQKRLTQHLIDEKDEDGNGTLNAAELCISEDVFNQVDTDGDGELTSEELIEGADQIREAMGPPPGMPMMPPSESEESEEKTLLDYINQDEEDDSTQTILDLLF